MKRKIMERLLTWKNSPGHLPLVIRGLRQVGKTYIVKQFAQENYENAFILDFRKKPDLGLLFNGAFDIEKLSRSISALPSEDKLIKSSKMVPGKTVLIFDEIQDCPNARSSLRYFKEDGRFDVICTGSMLGVSGYRTTKQPHRGIPVGSEEILTMTAMDFEEFLLALNVDQSLLETAKSCLDEEKEIPEFDHRRLLDLVRQYVVIGGLPEVVQKYVLTNDVGQARRVQKRILTDYESDFGSHLNDNGEIVIDEVEKARLMEVFRSIPRQLAKENAKFKYSIVAHGARSRTHEDALSWLEGYGLVTRCHNLSTLERPLSLFEVADQFKVFVNDTGLFTAMLDDDTPVGILADSLGMGKGPIYENLVSEAFHKAEKKQYYFARSSGLEIDFIATIEGKTMLIEAKAKEGKTKAAKEVLGNPSYQTDGLLKLTAQNVGRVGNVLTAPYYLSAYIFSK